MFLLAIPYTIHSKALVAELQELTSTIEVENTTSYNTFKNALQ